MPGPPSRTRPAFFWVLKGGSNASHPSRREGRLGKPVEFGYKAQVVDNGDGLILDYSVHIGNPADNELLRPAIDRITTHLGVTPSLVTADRGYWDSTMRPTSPKPESPPWRSPEPANPRPPALRNLLSLATAAA